MRMGIVIALLLLFVMIVVQQRMFDRRWHKNLSVEMGFDRPQAMEGEDLAITEMVTNRKLMFIPSANVKFRLDRAFVFDDSHRTVVSDYTYRNDIYTLLSYQKVTAKYMCHATHRGLYEINDTGISCADLFMDQTATEPLVQVTQSHILIYPKIYSLVGLEQKLMGLMGTAKAKQRLYEDPFTFTGIREYQPYDDRKRINWAASAKTGTMQVSIPDYTTKQRVRILLNFDSPTYYQEADLMEESIRLAASFVDFYYQREQVVSLKMNVEGEEEITVEKNHKNIGHALKNLSQISYDQGVLSSIDFFRKCEVEPKDFIVFISACYRDDIYHMVMNARAEGTQILWVVPTNQSDLYLASDILCWQVRG